TDLILSITDRGFALCPLGIAKCRFDPLSPGGAGLRRRNVPPGSGALLDQLDRFELFEILAVAAPADEVLFRFVIEFLQARLQPLNLSLAQVELFLATVCQA